MPEATPGRSSQLTKRQYQLATMTQTTAETNKTTTMHEHWVRGHNQNLPDFPGLPCWLYDIWEPRTYIAPNATPVTLCKGWQRERLQHTLPPQETLLSTRCGVAVVMTDLSNPAGVSEDRHCLHWSLRRQ